MTNTELAEALRSITNLSACELLVVRAAADALAATTGKEPLVPDSDGWIEWKGGDMPVPKGTPVNIRHRDGAELADAAGGVYSLRWSHIGSAGDIIAYRIVK